MKAVDSHLLTLLKKSSQFIVPIYQRVYSWQQAECEQLWSDILRAGVTHRMGAHFTGSIVYVARGQSTNTSAEPDLIIDGQQRLTTVTLVLAALAQHLDTLPEDEREPWDGFSPKKIRNRYLLNDDEDGERQFKLVLSQGDRDALTPSTPTTRSPRNATWRGASATARSASTRGSARSTRGTPNRSRHAPIGWRGKPWLSGPDRR
jgi:uncharacterized protein with ParB-like and HNH nuclease domain